MVGNPVASASNVQNIIPVAVATQPAIGAIAFVSHLAYGGIGYFQGSPCLFEITFDPDPGVFDNGGSNLTRR
jgi:hypothetical protein